MGPAALNSPNTLFDAPRLTADTEKFQYQRYVRIWLRRIKAFATGGDNRAKGVTNSLGHALLAAMDASYQKVIEAAIDNSELIIDCENDKRMSFTHQKNIIELMLQIVSQDSTTVAVRQMVNMSR